MTHAYSDVLLVGGRPNQWVKYVNNDGNAAHVYVSTAVTTFQSATTGAGVYTFNPSPIGGIYTSYLIDGSLSATAPAAGDVRWAPSGITSHVVSYTVGDDAALNSTTVSGSPYTNTLPGAPAIATPAGVATGKVWDYGGREYNAKAAGLKGDGQYVTDATINSGSAVVNSATAAFTQSDVGKLACFQFAGASSASIPTTIASVQSATQCTLAATAGSTIASGGFFMWASDDTAAMLAWCVTVGAAHAIGYLPWGFYGVTTPPVISDACQIEGAGLLELWGNKVVNGNQDTHPTIPPYFVGSVIWQFGQNVDGVQVTANGRTVNGRHWGLMFAGMFASTGHGIHFLPPVDGANFGTGIVAAQWDSVKVFGHDGNHYGFRILNPFNSSFRTLHAYGGGGLQMRGDSATTFYGNSVFDDWYSITFLNGSAHGLRLEASGQARLNLLQFNRPQTHVRNPPTAIPGTTAPTSAQFTYTNTAQVPDVGLLCPDFESNVGSLPAYASSAAVASWNPKDGQGGSFLVAGSANDLALELDGTNSQAVEIFKVRTRPLGAGVVAFAIDKTGHMWTGLAVPTSGSLGTNVSSITPAGSDQIGVLTIVLGGAGAAAAAILGTITFGAAFANAPKTVLLIDQTGSTTTLKFTPATIGTASWQLVCQQALAAGTYVVGYWVF